MANNESPPVKRNKVEVFKVYPVLHESISTTEIKVRQVYSGKLKSKKDASTVLKLLPSLHPDLEHLKRIRSKENALEIVIGETLPEESSDLDYLIPDSICLTAVPSLKPLTSKQFKIWNEYWPCNFHPDKETEKLISENGGFSSIELNDISNNFNILLEKFKGSGSQCCGIYDPTDKEMVCVATSSPGALNHSAMNCLKILAETQNHQEEEKILRSWEFGEVLCKRIVRNKPTDYLCTGLEIYLSDEPCVMCAMALLHSRARKIFFMNENGRNGGLKSVVKLQFLEGVNHRFQVFHVKNEIQ